MRNSPFFRSYLTLSSVALGLGMARGDLLFYEPFDYAPNSALAGLMPALGAGGPWVDNSSGTGNGGSGQAMTVRTNGTTGADSGQTWPGIPSASTFVNSGGYLEGERRDDNSGHIPLAAEVTAKFIDGATIWLSFVAGATTVEGQPDNHHKPNVAIGQEELLDNRAQFAAGEAVGGGVAHNTSGGNPRARYWDDQNTDGLYEDFLGDRLSRISPQQLFVTKIEFGAVNETITTTTFSLDPFAAPTEADFDDAEQTTITTVNNLDNASFNTLSFHGSRSNYDEIRVATTFDDAVNAAGAGAAQDFAITAINYSAEDKMLTLTWDSQPGERYVVKYSTDLIDWGADLEDDVPADIGETTTATFELAGFVGDQEDAPRAYYFRVEKQ